MCVYVQSTQPGSLEEDWFFQALIECYLPLLGVLEHNDDDAATAPKITIGLSPTLLSLLDDDELKNRFPNWLEARLQLLPEAEPSLRHAAVHLAWTIERHRQSWLDCNGDLIGRFARLQQRGVVDLQILADDHLRKDAEQVLCICEFSGPPVV